MEREKMKLENIKPENLPENPDRDNGSHENPNPNNSIQKNPSGPNSKSEVIKIENLTKVYESGEIAVTALRDVTMTVRQGEFIAIMGASGSGKSTLIDEHLRLP